MRNKFWWEAGLSAEAAVYGCNIQSNHLMCFVKYVQDALCLEVITIGGFLMCH